MPSAAYFCISFHVLAITIQSRQLQQVSAGPSPLVPSTMSLDRCPHYTHGQGWGATREQITRWSYSHFPLFCSKPMHGDLTSLLPATANGFRGTRKHPPLLIG
mmetsp:Transcript_91290/g.158275  ORF Transcript_91290/g.158275 Transcript_91290/m.158275 type:complete len:103 (+) Transcript_91290:252-560(+)